MTKWEEVDSNTAVWLLGQKKDSNILHSSHSLHCWEEIFTCGGCKFKVEGTFSSDEVKVFKVVIK